MAARPQAQRVASVADLTVYGLEREARIQKNKEMMGERFL